MKRQEEIAQKTGNVFGGKPKKEIKETFCKKGHIFDFLSPMLGFLLSVIISLLFTGQYWLFGGKNNLLQAFQNADSFYSLFISSVVGLLICVVLFILQKRLNIMDFIISSKEGFNLLKSSLLVLALAWTFGNILQDHLQAGEYLGQMVLSSLPIFILPLIIFATSILVCASTGSAWATISILTPLAIPIVTSISTGNLILLYTTIGSLISGSLVGSHISPISDATIIASTSAGSYHLDHVATQTIYSIPAIIATAISIFLASILDIGYINKVIVSLVSGSLITIILLYILNKLSKKAKK